MEDATIGNMFLGLSNKYRLDIVNLLKNNDMSVNEIAEKFEVTQATISYHLKILKESGLVSQRRNKNSIIYSLNKKHIKILHEWLEELTGR